MMDYSDYRYIKAERRGKVLLLTLNRPEAYNAINGELHEELSTIFADVNEDSDANVVVLTGAGKAFCAGGDVKSLHEWTADFQKVYRESKKHLFDQVNLRQVTIAMVNGAATGLGATIALHCDMVIASEKARFGDAHIKVGIVPGDGGCVMWPLLIGISRAKQYLMTGDLISAAEADRLGLVNQVVPPEDLERVTFELAERLANGPTVAIQFTKQVINKVIRDRLELMYDEGYLREGYCLINTEDCKEAVRAFNEGRPPVFKGR